MSFLPGGSVSLLIVPKLVCSRRCKQGKQRLDILILGGGANESYIIKKVMELFGDVESFLVTNEDLAPAIQGKLLGYFNNMQKKACLQIEMAVVVDVSIYFVQSTYMLEGGPLALTCYETISSLTAAVNQAHYHNAQAMIRSITSNVNQQ